MDGLRRLLWLRLLVVAGPGVMLLWLHLGLDQPLSPWPVAVFLALMLASLLLKYDQTRRGQPVDASRLLGCLLLDVLALTVLLYASGGGSNPFVSLLLLPLVIAAALLPRALVWLVAGATVAAYTLLMFRHLPLPGLLYGHGPGFAAHLWGMWLVFVISALLIAGFVAWLAGSLRDRERQVARLREQALRDEQVLALGLFAAGAAHEMGTPLSTVAVLTQELRHRFQDDPQAREELDLLRGQVDTCKDILTQLLNRADLQADRQQIQSLDALLDYTRRRWQLLRPRVPLRVHCQGSHPASPGIGSPQTIGQVLISLLDNAADACPDGVELEGRWEGDQVTIEIRDRGRAPCPAVLGRAGQPFFSTKEEGTGIGLLLANAALERLGGRVSLHRERGTTCTRLDLPALGGAGG